MRIGRQDQQHINQTGHITDIHLAVLVDIGLLQIDNRGVVSQQIFDKPRHVRNLHGTVIVNVTKHHLGTHRQPAHRQQAQGQHGSLKQ